MPIGGDAPSYVSCRLLPNHRSRTNRFAFLANLEVQCLSSTSCSLYVGNETTGFNGISFGNVGGAIEAIGTEVSVVVFDDSQMSITPQAVTRIYHRSCGRRSYSMVGTKSKIHPAVASPVLAAHGGIGRPAPVQLAPGRCGWSVSDKHWAQSTQPHPLTRLNDIGRYEPVVACKHPVIEVETPGNGIERIPGMHQIACGSLREYRGSFNDRWLAELHARAVANGNQTNQRGKPDYSKRDKNHNETTPANTITHTQGRKALCWVSTS